LNRIAKVTPRTVILDVEPRQLPSVRPPMMRRFCWRQPCTFVAPKATASIRSQRVEAVAFHRQVGRCRHPTNSAG
jgi:hypothetical protein